ncbi:unnamed protein product [Adineta ricciae]|uniref:Uncharacterized protein n=1 Tax=Adineta ricciae TaxID=249248 RepID=A0A815VFG3_ADIRI|nr:unnamed protein product [Adineta ricciae]
MVNNCKLLDQFDPNPVQYVGKYSRRCSEISLPSSQSEDEDRDLQSRSRKISCRSPYFLRKTPRYQPNPKRMKQNSEKMINQPDDCSSSIVRDDIIRKMSICLSFYGNFVLIPAVEKTLKKINGQRFTYWYEMMQFIDSYDSPSADEHRKKLIDELMENMKKFVKNEGISDKDWRKMLCSIPDDVIDKFDYRLKQNIFDEIQNLVEQNRLPFDLNKSFGRLLDSAEKRAGKYIRK